MKEKSYNNNHRAICAAVYYRRSHDDPNVILKLAPFGRTLEYGGSQSRRGRPLCLPPLTHRHPAGYDAQPWSTVGGHWGPPLQAVYPHRLGSRIHKMIIPLPSSY